MNAGGQARWRAAASAEARRVGLELVILDGRSGAYIGLNATAALAWTMLAEGVPLDRIAAHVAETFSGTSAAAALADIDELARDLAARGLLVPWADLLAAETDTSQTF